MCAHVLVILRLRVQEKSSMLVLVSTTCLRTVPSTTWDNLHWHSAVCTSSGPVYLVICCLHTVHSKVPFLLTLFFFFAMSP